MNARHLLRVAFRPAGFILAALLLLAYAAFENPAQVGDAVLLVCFAAGHYWPYLVAAGFGSAGVLVLIERLDE